MSAAVAPSPSIWTMGSPGTRWIRKNTRETTTQRTGSVRRIRRRGFQRAVIRRIPCACVSFGRFRGVGCVEGSVRRREVFHGDAADAVSGHFGDLEAAAFVVDALARDRDVAELREEEAREGLDSCLTREDPVELVAEVAKSGRSVEDHGSGGGEQRRAADVELVFELADDLLQDVFGGDETDGGTKLVDGDGDVSAAFLKLLQELDRKLGLGNDGEFAHDIADGEAGFAFATHGERDGAEVHQSGDVLGVDDADEILWTMRGLIDGDARVLLLDDAGGGLLERHVGGEGEDLAAGSHNLADCDVVELDGAMDDLFLKDGE